MKPEEMRENAAADLYNFIKANPGEKETTPQEVLFFLAVLREITVLHSDGETIDTTGAEFDRGYAAGIKDTMQSVYTSCFSEFCEDPRLYSEVQKAVNIFIESYPAGEDFKTIQLETAAILNAIFEEAARAEELATAFDMPTGPFTDAFMEILAAGADLPELPDRKRRVTHSATYEVLEATNDENRNKVTKETATEYLSFEIDDISRHIGSNAPAKNVFMLTLIELNKQALFNGVLTRDYITFPLQALVDNGSYKDQRAARRGFLQGLDVITNIKVSGYTTRGKEQKQLLTGAAIEVLFPGGNVKNNICTVYVNPRISWEIVAPYFSILPKYYFKLPNRAKDLLYFIFFLARQNADKIKKDGYFTISFKAIHSRLNLPLEDETKNPQRDIIDPIESALEEIEEENKLVYTNGQFNLLPIIPKPDKGKKRVPVSKYINEGKLKVSLSGELAEKFKEISTRKTKKITEAQKKAARIEEKAAAIKKQKAQEKENPT